MVWGCEGDDCEVWVGGWVWVCVEGGDWVLGQRGGTMLASRFVE